MASGSPSHVYDSGSKIVQKQAMDPFSSLGQLSYAPATHTTVVTTTTTTTTSFPPIIIPAPRNLRDRDPKEYPLARSLVPEPIRRFAFNLAGTHACFEEAENTEESVQEHTDLHNALKVSNGRIRTIQEFDNQYATPNRSSRQSSGLHTFSRSTSGSKKRSPSPPSIAEAAELASLHRRNKKLRGSLQKSKGVEGSRLGSNFTPEEYEDVIPATPDTDVGGSGHFKFPGARTSSRRINLRSASAQRRNMDPSNLRQPIPASWKLGQSPTLSQSSSSGTLPSAEQSTTQEHPLSASVIDGPGIAATPPIAENDLEPIGPFTANDSSFTQQPMRPPPLDTAAAQDASLPGPSLSPITAAANLAQHPGPSFTGEDGDDDTNEVSSLDISQSNISEEGGSTGSRRRSSRIHRIELPDRLDGTSPNPQLPTPTLMDIPTMLDTFDAMPEKMKTYVMFQLLRRCPKPTLHFVADVVNPALKCDFVGLLPLELSLNIVKYLDVQSMCNAAQVSKKWRHIIDTDETAWKELLEKDGYNLPEGELERAVREGWGWQYPHSSESYERDLRQANYNAKSESDTSPGSPGSSAMSAPVNNDSVMMRVISGSGRPKRKAATKHGSSKKQRRKGPSTLKSQAPSWSRSVARLQGPIAYAEVAAAAIPNPNIGLPGLRSMHLYKSLYQRHHLIRKSWMKEDTRPKHIAFRAHQRHVVTCLQFDTEKILTGSDDTNINVYDTKTGALRQRLEGHEGGVWALQYEGNTLVSGSTDRSVRVWDIESGRCTHTFQGHTSTVRCLVILKPTQIGETAEGQPIMMPKEPLIITGSRDSTLRVWKLPKAGDRSVIQAGPPVNDSDNPYFIRSLTGHHHSVRAIAAHGDTLVSGSYDCTVRVWKISTGEVLHRLQGHSQKVYSVVLDHARNRCISGSMDNLVKVWSLDNGQCLYTLEGHTSLVGLLDLSHERLVSAAADSTLRIWDPENGQCKSTLCAHTGAITCFQHDGQKVISGSDRTLKMWNVKTGEFVKDLLTDLSGVWQVKFNERRCVAAVQRNNITYIEVLDFGACRDGVLADQRGRRIVVDSKGREIEELTDDIIEAEPV